MNFRAINIMKLTWLFGYFLNTYVAILAICTFYLLNLKNHFNSHYFKKVAKIANMK